MDSIYKNRVLIHEMISKSHEVGFSPMFSGENEAECERNFYLSLGLDENGSFPEANKSSELVKEEDVDNIKEHILRW
ncbi:hypothetical protein [Pantoea agglomerans]|uniref:hypothetical protein n=1 Tax=Enterobacter agglomerans TaxID=549 RepID=UPI0015FC0ACA|nr:hypothetical protein [Pantoea agglomerans]MBA8871867.1 hypothetical protein [Pantoea agglomerans]MBA8876245.1 hypothetical protein [Pantoea agglomerans]